MPKYKFGDLAINCTKKKVPTVEEYATYIGLEHMDTKCIKITRWGSNVPIKGEKLIMHKGDVLLGKRNAYLRRAAIAPHDGVFSAHGMVLQPKTEVIDHDFFPLFIASDYFFDEAIRISVGSLSPTINWSDLKELEFNLPTLEEQRKIAKLLWSIQNAIESYKKMINMTNKIVDAKFIEMFGDPLTDDEKYLNVSLSDIFLKPKAGEWGTDDPDGIGTPVLRTTNFTDEGFVNYDGIVTRTIDKKKVEAKSIKYGDILIEKSGGSTDKAVGRVVIFEGEDDKYLNNNFTAVLRLNGKYDLNFIYVFYYLYINYWSGGTKDYENKTTGIHNLNLTEFLDNTMIPLPPRDVQDRFASLFVKTNNSKNELMNKINDSNCIYTRIITDCLKEKED